MAEVVILVTGSRYYQHSLTDHCDALATLAQHLYPDQPITLIHGGAKGVDSSAAVEGQQRGWTVSCYPADWQQYGKAAGPLRNQRMVDEQPHLALAVLDPDSRGTLNCLQQLAHSTTTHGSRLTYTLLVDPGTGEALWLDPQQLRERFRTC